MKILALKELMSIAGGNSTISEDGVLITSISIPAHNQDKILEVSMVINDSTTNYPSLKPLN